MYNSPILQGTSIIPTLSRANIIIFFSTFASSLCGLRVSFLYSSSARKPQVLIYCSDVPVESIYSVKEWEIMIISSSPWRQRETYIDMRQCVNDENATWEGNETSMLCIVAMWGGGDILSHNINIFVSTSRALSQKKNRQDFDWLWHFDGIINAVTGFFFVLENSYIMYTEIGVGDMPRCLCNQIV